MNRAKYGPWVFSSERGPAVALLIDSCITQLKAQEPAGACNESKTEGEEKGEHPEEAHVTEAGCEVLD